MTKNKENMDIRSLQKNLATDINPFVEDVKKNLKTIEVPTGRKEEAVSFRTGELGEAQFFTRKLVDREVFMRDYSATVDKKLGLSRTARNVKQAVMVEYQEQIVGKKSRFDNDLIFLRFFDEGLSGKDIGMSERTFRRGFKELLEKRVLAPYKSADSSMFWINPSVFFMGDRVRWVEEWEVKHGDAHQERDLYDEDI